MWSVELRDATLRIYNSACCSERFSFLGMIDISATFRDVWEPVPYEIKIKRFLYIRRGRHP